MKKPLPFASLYFDGGGTAVAGDVRTVLARDPRLQVLDNPKQAEAVVTILSENQSKDILTLNVGGKINEYQLTYTAVVRTVLCVRAGGAGHDRGRAPQHELLG
ncbi:hypothetical protein JOS77_14755 [Chromobacterium haemolyticum]|nr:hypothetical protein JOS77_14755 [Chromobacterium haemolyticum]